MSGAFVIVFLLALVLVVFWRAALVVGLALLITFLVIGVGGAGQAVEGAMDAGTSAPGAEVRAGVPPR